MKIKNLISNLGIPVTIAFGFLLGLFDMGPNTWKFWIFIALFIAFGLINRYKGKFK